MNPHTGEVAYLDEQNAARFQEFVPVPRPLQRQAARVIARGEKVDLTSNTKLAKFAATKRKQQRKSRKANRKK